MAESQVAKIPKPQLRGQLMRNVKVHLGASFLVASGAAFCVWYFVARKRKLDYAEFYRTYDADKEFERMRQAGIFQYVPPK